MTVSEFDLISTAITPALQTRIDEVVSRVRALPLPEIRAVRDELDDLFVDIWEVATVRLAPIHEAVDRDWLISFVTAGSGLDDADRALYAAGVTG